MIATGFKVYNPRYVVLGFLSYYNNRFRISNNELMLEFEGDLADESFGEVSQIIKNLDKLLEATVNGDSDEVDKILHYVHNTEIPGQSLRCIVIDKLL